MIATTTFIKNILPGGVVPTDAPYASNAHDAIRVPFAVMRWDDGLDYNEDGTSYQDSPPEWYLAGAFDTRADAEQFIAEGDADEAMLETDVPFQLYNFIGAYVRE